MDQKQYEVMSLIMAKGRKFLDEIYKIMFDNGLLDEKYCIDLEIVNRECQPIDCDYLSAIELRVSFDHDDSATTWNRRMEQWNKDGKGWTIINDPIREMLTVPEYDDSETGSDGNGEESGVIPEGKTEEPAAASGNDSLWFHDDGGDPPMVRRGDLNGSVAESDPGR